MSRFSIIIQRPLNTHLFVQREIMGYVCSDTSSKVLIFHAAIGSKEGGKYKYHSSKIFPKYPIQEKIKINSDRIKRRGAQ